MSSLDYLDLCRLCLVKDQVSVPIFDGEGDVRQIFLKIAACLPVKLTRDDKLPKKICNDCVYKVELFYEFWNTTSNSEKQLMQWLGEVDVNDKQTYVTAVINQDQSSDNRLDGNVMQQTNEHQNNMGMNIIETMSLEMPMMMSTDQTQMTINTTNNSNSQSIQALPGTSAQQKDGMGESEEDNSDDDMDRDEGLPVKEEIIQDTNRIIEPGAFLNVSLPCDEPGPSGLQQQKNADIPDMVIGGQTTESDNKAGFIRSILPPMKKSNSVDLRKFLQLPLKSVKLIKIGEIKKSITVENPVLKKPIMVGKSVLKKSIEPKIKIKPTISIAPTPEKPICIISSVEGSTKLKIKAFNCPICNKEFASRNEIRLHSVVHKDERNHKCDICNKGFKRACTLKVHRRIHDKNRQHVCPQCNHAFAQKDQLDVHLRRHLKIYCCHCELCGKGFVTTSAYRAHMNIQHCAGEHVCTICKKAYPDKWALKRHMVVHEPDYKPPQLHCNYCDKILTSKNSLSKHTKKHTGQNKFDCDICGKSVASSQSLRDHMRIHNGEKTHTCEYCGKTFSKKTTLMCHFRVHTGEKPYTCDVCKKSFSQSSTLVIHKRHHTGERPYKCEHCQRSFVSRTLLNNHAKTHRLSVMS